MMPEHVFQISLYVWNILSSPKPSDMAQGSVDALIAVVREVDPNVEKGILQSAVKCFRKQQHFQFAKETLVKMNEPQELIGLYM
jgi:hypothetical protein